MQRTLLFVFSLLVCSMGVPEASAQKIYHIGALVAEDQFVPAFNGFKKKMAELGYIEGKNIRYDFYNAKGDRDSIQKLAEKLVHAKPDLVVTSSTTATVTLAKLTKGTDLPVVFLSAGNPLRFVKSYPSSGNNLTGISAASLDLTAKRLELLKELVPKVKRVVSLNAASGFPVGAPNILWMVVLMEMMPSTEDTNPARRSGSRSPFGSARGCETRRPSP